MRSLWIGPPGRLREVPDAATDYDRSISLGVIEFAALGGGVTVTSLATPPRRLALSWTGLLDDDARWLEALARRVFGSGPLAVLDPVTRNAFDGPQSQGYAPRTGWALAGFGALTQQPDRTMILDGTDSTSRLYWVHSHWLGWPVVPGRLVGFASALSPSHGLCRVEFFDAAGTYLGDAGPSPVVNVVAPPGAVFAFPKVDLAALSAPTAVGGSVLRIGDPVTLGETAPIGDGCPAMTITSYADNPRPTSRDLSLTLVEVRRARS